MNYVDNWRNSMSVSLPSRPWTPSPNRRKDWGRLMSEFGSRRGHWYTSGLACWPGGRRGLPLKQHPCCLEYLTQFPDRVTQVGGLIGPKRDQKV